MESEEVEAVRVRRIGERAINARNTRMQAFAVLAPGTSFQNSYLSVQV